MSTTYDLVRNSAALFDFSAEGRFFFGKMLFEDGVFVNVFISPGVPQGRQMMRTSYMSTHEDEHLDYIIESFTKNGKKLGLI